MSEVSGETTMEDILASIKKIIADDSDALTSPRPFRKEAAAPARRAPVRHDDVLDLTLSAAAPVQDESAPIVSAEAVSASRHALETLNSAVSAPVAPVRGASVEDLATELLRPMLKDWLDAHLPEIVERLVAKEVARITGRDQQ
jgi:cell pole-organizing protein PopZ